MHKIRVNILKMLLSSCSSWGTILCRTSKMPWGSWRRRHRAIRTSCCWGLRRSWRRKKGGIWLSNTLNRKFIMSCMKWTYTPMETRTTRFINTTETWYLKAWTCQASKVAWSQMIWCKTRITKLLMLSKQTLLNIFKIKIKVLEATKSLRLMMKFNA